MFEHTGNLINLSPSLLISAAGSKDKKTFKFSAIKLSECHSGGFAASMPVSS